MKRNEFLKQVTEGRLLPVYLFLGEERLFHEELFRAALDRLLPDADESFNFSKFNGGDLENETLIRQLETPPFFGNTRVIYLEGLENNKTGLDEVVLKGSEYLADGVYLFVSVRKLDGRKKVHQGLQKHLNVVDCSPLSLRDLPAWISQRSQTMGLKLTPVQAGLIARRLGTDLLRVRTELEKLRTFAGKQGLINDVQLDALLPLEPEPNIFNLIDAVAAGNPRQGMPRLQELLDAGEPEIKILITLARQIRNIAAALEGRRTGLNHRQLAALLGINPYVAEKSFVQSSRFSLSDLLQIMERLILADFRIKTGQRNPRLELELAIVEICHQKKMLPSQ